MPELAAQAHFLLRAPVVIPDLRLFRRNVGVSRYSRYQPATGPERFVRFGIKGQSDIFGLFKGGRHIELELKAVGKRLTVEQDAWRVFCASWEVPWLLPQERRDESVEECVARWCGEIKSL
jgi:hypothetical protein